MTNAAHHENAVVFARWRQRQFEAVREAVEAAIAAQGAPRAAGASEAASPPVFVADELAKLGALLWQGLLTQAEFDQQKVRLLGS